MRLRMPFAAQMMLCGYKNASYQAYWGYPHYGVDISAREAKADGCIRASGDGIVLAADRDNTLGFGIAILYKECESRSGDRKDLVARYMHLGECRVKKGQSVCLGTILGTEGKEGTTDYHLHFELDTDTRYPLYTPQVSANHTFWAKGTDTTLDPSLWLWRGEAQVIVPPAYNPAWLNNSDNTIPAIETTVDLRRRLLTLAHEIIDGLEEI